MDGRLGRQYGNHLVGGRSGRWYIRCGGRGQIGAVADQGGGRWQIGRWHIRCGGGGRIGAVAYKSYS